MPLDDRAAPRSTCCSRDVGAGRAGQPRVPRRRAAAQPRGDPRRDRAGRDELAAERGVRVDVLDHHQRHAADRGRRATSSRSTGSRSRSASTASARRTTALRPFRGGRGSYRPRDRARRAAARAPAADAGLRARHGHARQPRAARDARRVRRARASTASASRRCCARRPAADELGRDELADDARRRWSTAATEFERRVIAGERYPFANVVNAMREIHRGTHRPYPCGAGAGYLGVVRGRRAGGLPPLRRRRGRARWASVTDGVDRDAPGALAATSATSTARSRAAACWARYLCGGGCHHEVIARGRPACDYIRGWLHWCARRLRPAARARGPTTSARRRDATRSRSASSAAGRPARRSPRALAQLGHDVASSSASASRGRTSASR